jgi:hypothetical protein
VKATSELTMRNEGVSELLIVDLDIDPGDRKRIG